MRLVGALAIVYGLGLATVGKDPATGLVVVLVGWLIRRATRPELCTCGNEWMGYRPCPLHRRKETTR